MNHEALANLIALGEGFTTELKRSGTSNLGREICAFANATGGVILIGVADGGEIVGVAGHNRLRSEVQCIARSAEPPIAIDVESEVSESWVTTTFKRPAEELGNQVGTKSGPSWDQVEILRNSLTERSIAELMEFAGRSNRTKFRNQILQPLLEQGWMEMTIPDKPTSSKQKYRLTAKGKDLLAELKGGRE